MRCRTGMSTGQGRDLRNWLAPAAVSRCNAGWSGSPYVVPTTSRGRRTHHALLRYTGSSLVRAQTILHGTKLRSCMDGLKLIFSWI